VGRARFVVLEVLVKAAEKEASECPEVGRALKAALKKWLLGMTSAAMFLQISFRNFQSGRNVFEQNDESKQGVK
jgi:hypothetical protein